MPATSPVEPARPGGIHIGDVGGNVDFSALGDIVGGDKITTITTTIQVSVEAVTQRPLNTSSPYRGLDRFEDRDKDLFFGRDQLIKSLLGQLDAGNVLLVLGASGSGKSSVVRAGLLPQLSQLIGARFRYFTFVPDLNPFESLRGALLAAGFSQAQTRELLDANPATPARLVQTLRREGEQWLLFIDQFEEIFTVCGEAPRQAFIAALLALAQDPASPAKLVLAMRADFLDRFCPFPEFAKIIQKDINLVADMHADELRQAIEQPAARHGVVFEQGLVEEIIKDVQGQAGSLPLLQYTLDLLWQEEARQDDLAGRHLKTRAYRELGGVRGALQKRANEIYASFGDGSDAKAASPSQEIVRQIFLRLVDLAGEGSSAAAWRPVRRRAPMAMFPTAPEQEILQALINQKLLVSNREGDDSTVEVAHEALFASWQRLKNWIEVGKQVIFTRNRLTDDARRWQRRQQESGAEADEELLAGSRLSQALEMRARGDFVTIVGGLGETETQFLDASAALRDRHAQEEQARQQRELEAAKRLAEARTLAAARLRKGLVAAIVLLLAAIASGFFARRESIQAKRESAEAIKNEARAKNTSVQADFDLAVLSREKSEGVDPRALEHLARALRTDPYAALPREYLKSLLSDRQWSVLLFEPLRHGALVQMASFSPDGRRILTASEDHTARVWDAESGNPVGEPLHHEDLVQTATFSPDGRRVLTASKDATARVWDTETGKPVGAPLRHRAWVHSASFSPDGLRVVTASYDGTAQVWDTETGRPMGEPLRHKDGLQTASFSPDGRRILTASRDKTAQVWDAETGKPVGAPLRHDHWVETASFSPDGRRVVTASWDHTAQVWDAETGSPVGERLRHAFEVRAVAFSPDGHRVATGSADKTAQVWDTETGKPVGEPMHHEAEVWTISFSPDGRHVLTGSGDKTAQVWDAETGQPVGEPLRHDASVWAASFSPDGHRIVTASGDKTARVWDADTGKPVGEFSHHAAAVQGASFSPDGRRIVTASYDRTARVWDAATGQPVSELLGHTDRLQAASFSPDGHRVVTASWDHTARVWNAETGQQVGEPLRHAAWVQAASFSPDGRRVVTASGDHTARIWDAETGKAVGEPLRHGDRVEMASFSPDGRRVVTASYDKTARVWDAETGKPVGEPLRHNATVYAASFSPDGRRVVTGSFDTTARVWDAETGKPVGEPLRHDAQVQWAIFSPDGRRIVTGPRDHTMRIWDAETGKPVGEPLRHTEHVEMASFSPDGHRIVTASADKTARLWDAETGKPVSESLRHEAGVWTASFSPDDRRIVTSSTDKTARVWDVAVDLTAPLPPWVPDLAEALAGQRLNEAGQLAPPKKTIPELRLELLALKGDDFWSRFGRWFFMRGPNRTISPDSRITVGELERLQAGEEKARTGNPR